MNLKALRVLELASNPLKRGDSRQDYVEHLQSILVTLGHDLGTYGQDKDGCDGDFGSATESAVKEFQKENKDFSGKALGSDGIVGKLTADALNSACSKKEGWDYKTPEELIGSEEPDKGSGHESAVNELLPIEGPGFHHHFGAGDWYDKEGGDHWGTKELVDFIIKVGERWHQRYPDGPRVQIGDMSLKGGGPMPPHKSHQLGVDVDIRPVRKDGLETGLNFKKDPDSYDQNRTQEMIDLFYECGNIDIIFFNDSKIKGVVYEPGHDDHIHVRIK